MQADRARRQPAALPASAKQADASDYRLGAIYALTTAALLALQEPFSALAARKLHSLDFVAFTQIALVVSIPLLLARPGARRDFLTILTTAANWPKLIALFGVGCAGLLLYDVALSSAHPIITAAVLNLSPFWAALVARIVSKRNIPRPRIVFILCFVTAFAGAMMVAFSQIDADVSALKRDLLYSLFHSRWALALPMPIFFALSGTLVYEWFRTYDEGAAIASNFLVSAAVLLPGTILFAHGAIMPRITSADAPAIFLLLIGTLAASAAGRVFYQAALTATRNDNGFVTMFFLAIPAISAGVSWPLSLWITDLHLDLSALFFEGLFIVMAPLVVFSISAARRN
jgi:drug/metabolite transporter (DMT)-like permease